MNEHYWTIGVLIFVVAAFEYAYRTDRGRRPRSQRRRWWRDE